MPRKKRPITVYDDRIIVFPERMDTEKEYHFVWKKRKYCAWKHEDETVEIYEELEGYGH